jgi:hypothetical protein
MIIYYNIKAALFVAFLGTIFLFFSNDTAFAATNTVRIYSSSGDGRVYTSPYPGAWNIQHADTVGRSFDSTATYAGAASGAWNTSEGYIGIDRAFTAFDTSAIPDNAVIDSASLNLYTVQTLDDFNDQYGYIAVLQGTQSSTSTLVNSDIDNCGDAETNPTKGSSDVDVTTISTNIYLPISLNSTGLGWISKTGYSKLCLRTGQDIENHEQVNNSNSWKRTLMDFNTSEAAGTSTDPYLEITYTVPDGVDRASFIAAVTNAVADKNRITRQLILAAADGIFNSIDAGRNKLALVQLRLFKAILKAERIQNPQLDALIELLKTQLQ